MSSPEIIVLEPSGKQKKYTLKPHGDFDKVQKKWRSHLKNIGASWSEKKKFWTLSLDKLKDFEKIQSIISKEDSSNKKEEHKSDRKENKKKRKYSSSSSEEHSSENSEAEEDNSENDDSDEESSDSDEEVINFLKEKIKSMASSSHNSVLSNDIDNSEEEDVIRISRRIRYIMNKMHSIEKRVNDLEEENAFLHKQLASFKK